MARIVTENDIGKGLAIEGDKLVAKVSAAAGNAIQATEEGLFVAPPAAATVDVHLAGAEYDKKTKTLKLKLSDDTTVLRWLSTTLPPIYQRQILSTPSQRLTHP